MSSQTGQHGEALELAVRKSDEELVRPEGGSFLAKIGLSTSGSRLSIQKGT